MVKMPHIHAGFGSISLKSGHLWMVGAIGFEPTTYGTQNRRATKLRYAPTVCSLAVLARREKDESSRGGQKSQPSLQGQSAVS